MNNVEIIRQFISEWDAPSPNGETLGSYFTENALYHNIPMEPVEGKAAITATLGGMAGMMTSKGWDLLNIVGEGNIVMTERIDKFEAGENKVALPVMGVFELTDGKIASWREYFDLVAEHLDFTCRHVGGFGTFGTQTYPPRDRQHVLVA